MISECSLCEGPVGQFNLYHHVDIHYRMEAAGSTRLRDQIICTKSLIYGIYHNDVTTHFLMKPLTHISRNSPGTNSFKCRVEALIACPCIL